MDLGDLLWGMLAFFFWFMFIWVFIGLFADVFRREDLSGWGKAGWTALLIVLPFIGCLVYMIARPKMTAQDRRMVAEAQERQNRIAGYSTADEVAKLAALRQAGEITSEEYESMKSRAVMAV
jgi:hypothetical protein